MAIQKFRILFVCMGNICRSPTAEAVFRRKVKDTGLAHLIECDSVGTHDYHIGEAPDERSMRAALRRGYDMSSLRGRQIAVEDFMRFDRVYAMDAQNLALLKRVCPQQHVNKLALYCDCHEHYAGRGVPDPYYGDAQGFEHVLDLVEQVSDRLLALWTRELPRTPDQPD